MSTPDCDPTASATFSDHLATYPGFGDSDALYAQPAQHDRITAYVGEYAIGGDVNVILANIENGAADAWNDGYAPPDVFPYC